MQYLEVPGCQLEEEESHHPVINIRRGEVATPLSLPDLILTLYIGITTSDTHTMDMPHFIFLCFAQKHICCILNRVNFIKIIILDFSNF